MSEGDFWDRELETMAWPDVEAWQATRLADALERIGQTSDLYAGRLPSDGPANVRRAGLAALADIAPTSKDELRRAQDEAPPGRPLGLQQAVPLEEVIQFVSSSGTTGRPLYYGLTRRDLETWSEVCATAFFTAGFRPKDVVAHLVGLPMVAGGLPYADGFRRLGATIAWLGGFPTERVLAALGVLQVSGLLATTSFGVHLVESCRSITGRDASELGIRKLQLGGEPGLSTPAVRRLIADGWGTEHIREGMGLADVLAAMWAECEEQDGMHFNAQRAVTIELVEPDSFAPLAWREGASGEVLYTTFEREATPVIRYASADRVVVTAMGCPCGRTSPRMRVLGRTDDMLIYKGMNVFPTAIVGTILDRLADRLQPHVRIFKESSGQVRFDSPIPLEVEAAAGVDLADYPGLAAEAERAVREHLQIRVAPVVVAPGTLPRSSHKTPLVVVPRHVGDTR
jgi:phenylacetate-CoA ligase/benzoylacetate-CoA ligase